MTKQHDLRARQLLFELGYRQDKYERFGRTNVWYYLYHKDGEQGQLKVMIHVRHHYSTGRYPEGITYKLLEKIDEFVFWFAGEEKMYIVPARWLLSIFKQGKPTINGSQWICNLRVNDDTFEFPGIGEFPIPPDYHRQVQL
jgi:hypothetical protein